jgi:hypothetical protein
MTIKDVLSNADRPVRNNESSAPNLSVENQAGAAFFNASKASELTSLPQLQIDYGSYHDTMHVKMNTLNSSLSAKDLNPTALKEEIADLAKSASWWERHEQKVAGGKTSDVVKDLQDSMAALQKGLDALQNGNPQSARELMVKGAAGAENDLVNLEHIDWHRRHDKPIPTPGPGPEPVPPPEPKPPGTPDIPGGTQTNHLENEKWKINTNAPEIGGSGKVFGVDVTNNGNVLDYRSRVGAYGDTLISHNVPLQPSDKKFQLGMQFKPSQDTLKNMQCLEQDFVITDNNQKQAVVGSQFNFAEKAPAGMCWFQTWDTEHSKWMNGALVPIPKAGEYNDLKLTAHLNGDGTYTYDPLVYNGKQYDLANNTFNMKSTNWRKNEMVVQLQEDGRSSGGTLDVEYTNINTVSGS